jgi:translocation and assembly module TamB
VATPVVSGSITVEGGLYENGASGTVLDQLTLRVRAEGQHLTIEELSATDGGEGRFSGRGELVLDAARDFPIDLDLQLQRARLIQLDDLTATASGEVAIDGTATDMALTGTITIDRADATISGGGGADIQTIEVEEVGGDRPEDAAAASSSSSTILDLDLVIDMPGRVFVRGFGLSSEWKGKLQVTGPATAPRIGGRLEVRKGYFDLLDRRFDLRRGEILFTGASPPVPMLDIEATTQTADIRAIVHIHDRADKPKIDFESEPPLPEDEVLSYVMFGEESSEISAMQAAQLVSAANQLTGGSDLLGDLRGSLGVDTLDFSHDSATAESKVRAGKYLTDDVYVEVESGQAEQSGRAKVEVEILPGLAVQADTGEDQRTGIGLEWRYDY